MGRLGPTLRIFGLVALFLSWRCMEAGAQTPPPAANSSTGTGGTTTNTALPPNSARLPTIKVTATHTRVHGKPKARGAAPANLPAAQPPPSPNVTGARNIAGGPPIRPTTASQMTVSGQDLNDRAVTQPGAILEAAPGLAVVAHADGGKANQYYLRGYNLDHGTDFAVFVDDMPINLPTHAHGQGYTDLNWLMPETIGSLDIRKGPYFADVGDFASAGSLFLNLRDSVEKKVVEATVGSFGYDRVFTMGSTKAGDGSLLYAAEANTYNGPWTVPDDMQKFSGLLRYSQGTATDGFSATAMAYSNVWNTTEQNALRAITSGQIGLYGEIDPTDGGDTSRYSLSAQMAQSDADGSWKANAYLVKYELDLYNDFTWFLTDHVDGDQFRQHDNRVYGGAGASRTIDGTLFGRPTETVFGFQSRYDDIGIVLNNTVQRQFLSSILADHVSEGNAGIFTETTVHWTNWLSTTLGWRGDYFDTSVNSMLQTANSGKDEMAIGSPKFRMVIGPFYNTEFFIGAGMGYHSNDARSTVITEVPGDPSTPEGTSPLLVRSRGGEVGVRTKIVPGFDSSVSLFYLHQDSELFFDGDTGATTAGLPSQRTGVELTNDYRPVSWMHIDADLALTRARFLGFDTTQEALYQSLAPSNCLPAQVAACLQAQIGNAPGNYVYNAPWMVASAGITLGEKTGWFGDLRWRYISSRPLTEDGTFQSPPLSIFNAQIGYRFDNGWSVRLDGLNLLNSQAPQAEYAYGSLLQTDSLFAMCFPKHGPPTAPAAVCQNGVMDYALHPIEPLAVRLTIAAVF
jgi:outer membrane receptor protein involved in Fe transport